jgi:hypothetical protein
MHRGGLQTARRQRTICVRRIFASYSRSSNWFNAAAPAATSAVAASVLKHQRKVHRAAPAEVKADQRRQQHERGQPRLDQIGEDRRPTFLHHPNTGCRSA